MAHCRSRGGAVAPVELRAGTLARDSGRPGCDVSAAGLSSGHCSMSVKSCSRRQHGAAYLQAGCLSEGLLGPPGERYRAAGPEAARQLRRRQPSRPLQQCQRIGVRLSDDLRPRLEPAPRIPAPGSAVSRRAANLSACVEARASHCPSSATHTSGRSAPPLTASRVRPGPPETGPALRPNGSAAPPTAGAGKAHHDPASARSAEQPAKAGPICDCMPTAPHPALRGRPGQVVNQHGLAYARLAAHHQGPGAGRAAHLGTGPGFPGHRPAILRARRARPKRDPDPTGRQIKSAGAWPGTRAPGMPARGR